MKKIAAAILLAATPAFANDQIQTEILCFNSIDSIKTSITMLLVAMSAAHAGSGQPLLTGDNWELSTSCDAKYKCSTIKTSGTKELARVDFPYAPVSAKEDHGTIEILYSCGTECSATYFILPDNSKSGPYSLVTSVDYEKGTLLSLSKNEIKLFKFSPAEKNAIKTIKVKIPETSTLPSRIIDSKLKDHIYYITFRDATNKKIDINIEQ